MSELILIPESFIDICTHNGVTPKSINLCAKALFPKSTIDTTIRKKQITRYKEKLNKLREIPVIEQRSPEWYEVRKNLITASDFAQALGDGKFSSQKQLYKNKCGYEEVEFNGNIPPLKWGTMFEYVAQTIYAQRNNVKIYEFGLIKHPYIPYFGASPDGISENGIMLEIKCPFKRKIDGQIPLQYYYQIQGQLDVCDLDECDYLECELEKSSSFIQSSEENGLIIEILSSGKYIYSDVKIWNNMYELESWKIAQMKDNNLNDNDIVLHFWALKKYSVIRVMRNKDFFNEKITLLKEVWDKIEKYRSDEQMYYKEVATSKKSSISMSDNVIDIITDKNDKSTTVSRKKSKKIEIDEFALC